MCRDARVYPNPEAFLPERFIAPDGSLITDNFPPTYGFGRRSVQPLPHITFVLTGFAFGSGCAGRSMADASVWIAIASILSVFRISHAKDEAGNNIPVPDEYIDGLVTYVFPSFAPPSFLLLRLLLPPHLFHPVLPAFELRSD
jgi:cytochrome P450